MQLEEQITQNSTAKQITVSSYGQSRLHNVIPVISAASENIFVPAIFLVALQWT